MYGKFIFDGYNLKKYATLKAQYLKTGFGKINIPKIGRGLPRPQG